MGNLPRDVMKSQHASRSNPPASIRNGATIEITSVCLDDCSPLINVCHWLCQCGISCRHRLPKGTGKASGTLIQHVDRSSIGIEAEIDEVNNRKSMTMLSTAANLALTETCLIAAMRKSHPRAESAGEESTVTAVTNACVQRKRRHMIAHAPLMTVKLRGS